jgi:RNA polymerase sigma factor (sigma-70 family)
VRAMWVARSVLPHEAGIRLWLRRAHVSDAEADDLVQEAYCRISALDAVDHIARPGAYFFSMVRNLLVRRLRQMPVVQFETIAGIEAMVDPAAGPEREVGARIDYDRLKGIMAVLPERTRRAIELRRIDGLSQREIAAELGISEGTVENLVHRGIRAIVLAWSEVGPDDENGLAPANGQPARERRT